MPAEIRIGTSGWHYKHWKGPFYPPDLPASKMLDYYFQHFDTVEINNTFYRLPPESALASWRDSTPANFRFAVKGSRYLTHMKKLADPEAGLEKFLSCAKILGRKLGPILPAATISRRQTGSAGSGGRYQGSYSQTSLELWAENIRAWRKRLKALYVYFDNDQPGYAPQNVLELKGLVSK
jgi:uncharacterized protein YecE (DUF72 family)